MPRAVEQAGLADQVAPLTEIAQAIIHTARPGMLFAGEPRAWRE